MPHDPARPCRPEGGFGLVIMMGMSLLMMRILFLKLMMRMPLEMKIKMMFRYGLVASLVIPVHLLPLITLLPSIIFILLSALLPESPVWLIRFVHPDDDANELELAMRSCVAVNAY